MTTQPVEDEGAETPTNYLKFQVPGFPYSVVSVPLTDEWIRHGVASARLVADLLTEAFPEPQREPERVQYPERNDSPRGGYGGPQQARRGPPAPPDPNAPYCREHNAPMKRNRYDNGWFCTRKDRSGNYCTEQVRD